MRARTIILLLTVLLTCGPAWGRVHRRAGIVDFVNDYVAEPEGDLCGAVADAWAHYLRHERQDEGVTLDVDERHGFMCYRHVSPEGPDSLTLQMCYWNCADKRHKLVATSVWTISDGYAVTGQFDGLDFMLYDSATGQSEPVSPEDYGLDRFYGLDLDSDGYDAARRAFYVTDAAGKTTYMTRDEWDEWTRNRSVNTFMLPREGKDIIQVTRRGHRQTLTRWRWNGSRFSRQ